MRSRPFGVPLERHRHVEREHAPGVEARRHLQQARKACSSNADPTSNTRASAICTLTSSARSAARVPCPSRYVAASARAICSAGTLPNRSAVVIDAIAVNASMRRSSVVSVMRVDERTRERSNLRRSLYAGVALARTRECRQVMGAPLIARRRRIKNTRARVRRALHAAELAGDGEAAREHVNDREGPSIEHHRPTDRGRVRSEQRAPQAGSQDDDVIVARQFLL